MNTAYIIDAVRTPIGRYGGALGSIRPDDLAAIAIKALFDRNPNVSMQAVEDVILGCANQAGEDNRNVARMALLLAGLPIEVGGNTVNRLCASGLQAIMDASRAVMLGEADVYVAGGVESMSRAPFSVAKSTKAFNRVPEMYDTTIGWRYINPKLSEKFYPYGMGETAENVAEKWKIDRSAQDEFAFNSQEKYWAAKEKNRFENEITPVTITPRKGDPYHVVDDEHPRKSTMEQLAKLRAVFRDGGSVTAGSSSGVNDGAAMLLIVSEKYVKENDLKPMAKIKSMAIAGVHPDCMGVGPVPATQKALQRAGLAVSDLDLIELNEAFASQSIACIQDLKLNKDIINVNGGSIALGHPLGASGARIATTLLHEMQKRDNVKYGLATMCVGVGQGAAIIFEKV